jgi:undecaprenyl-diphosphatase
MYISKTTTILEDPFAPLDRRELRLVERCVSHARDRGLTRTARLVTHAGNGWVYPVVSAFLFLAPIEHAARCIVAAIVSLAIAFSIYPPLKRALARTRPCHADRSLSDSLSPLDRYSFPSGHAMTAAAFGTPIIVAAPPLAIPIVIAACALVSWSRIALGHHYPSDIAAGTVLGAVIAATVALAIM